MQHDISKINESLAKYFCNVIHCRIAGQVPQGVPNRHLNYAYAVDDYIKKLCSNPQNFINEMKSVLALYNASTKDIMSVDLLMDYFVMNYNFEKVYKKLSGSAKVQCMMCILFEALMSYFKWIRKESDTCFLSTELTTEKKLELRDRLERKIRHNGVIVQFSIYKKTDASVPKKLFDKLRKEYLKLKDSSEFEEEVE